MEDPILAYEALKWEIKENEEALARLAIKASANNFTAPIYKASWKAMVAKIVEQEKELARLKQAADEYCENLCRMYDDMQVHYTFLK